MLLRHQGVRELFSCRRQLSPAAATRRLPTKKRSPTLKALRLEAAFPRIDGQGPIDYELIVDTANAVHAPNDLLDNLLLMKCRDLATHNYAAFLVGQFNRMAPQLRSTAEGNVHSCKQIAGGRH